MLTGSYFEPGSFVEESCVSPVGKIGLVNERFDLHAANVFSTMHLEIGCQAVCHFSFKREILIWLSQAAVFYPQALARSP